VSVARGVNAMKSKLNRAVISGLAVAWLGVTTIFLSVEPARAATVFDLTGTFTDSSTIAGTFTIDLTTGQVDAVNVTYLGVNYTSILGQNVFTGLTASGQTPIPVSYDVAFGSFYPFVDLAIRGTSAPASLISYAGGQLCSFDASCGPDQEGNFWASAYRTSNQSAIALQTGELTATTPLPAALPLFASGLGVIGLLARCRKRKASAI
jgi:hypothetical protein